MHHPATVLIIDDDYLVCRQLEQVLNEDGFIAFSVTCVDDALRLLNSIRPDVLVVDHFMLEMEGAELVSHLRASPIPWIQRMRVIGLSGGGAPVGRRLLDAGADAFVQKPLHDKRIARVVREVMASTSPGPLARGA